MSFKSYLSQNYQHLYKMPITRFSFSATDCCGLVFSVLLHAPIPSDVWLNPISDVLTQKHRSIVIFHKITDQLLDLLLVTYYASKYHTLRAVT